MNSPDASEEISPKEEIVAPPVDAATQAWDEARLQMRRMSRRALLGGALSAGAAYGGWRWLLRGDADGIPRALRGALQFNERVARAYFRPSRLSPQFPRAWAAPEPRLNGDYGLGEDFDINSWRLQIEGLPGMQPFEVTLKQIMALPPLRMTTELRCIEGWSVLVDWTGARLSDLVRHFAPQLKLEALPPYVGMSTPDGGYYVGLDRESALHPQSLLAYHINGKPLSMEHGAPLRLAIPVKYGIKNIKRIGTISFSKPRPADFWAEQGYDWYAGH